MLKTSDSIIEISKALSKAQGELKHALKDSFNPHFKSKYADLAAVIDAAKEPLSKNGLAVVQGVSSVNNEVIVTTRLLHSSGEWMESELSLTPDGKTAQKIGSAITYGRRYSLAAMVGVAQFDDDGNDASTKSPSQETKQASKQINLDEMYEAKPYQKLWLKREFDRLNLSNEMQVQYVNALKGKPLGAIKQILEMEGFKSIGDQYEVNLDV